MNKEKREIVEKVLENFDFKTHFENDCFIYWTKGEYVLNNKYVDRKSFEDIKEKIIKNNIKNELYSNSFSFETFLRYSKKYNAIEFYQRSIEIKYIKKNINKWIIIKKTKKIFKINHKNYVLINGNRWLSLKNFFKFSHSNSYITKDLSIFLLKKMLGDINWINDSLYSINISNKNSRGAKSLKEAVEKECNSKPSKRIEKFLDNKINEIIKLYKLIEKNDIHKLTNFLKNNIEIINNIINKNYQYKNSFELLFLYFLSKDVRFKENKSILIDYLNMCFVSGIKINLDISSYKTIKQKHDELSNEILRKTKNRKKLRVSKVFPKLKSTKKIKIEQIRSIERLNKESEILNHCVHTYVDRINSGFCSIYSLLFKNKRYTLQIECNKIDNDNFIFLATQLKGKRNCNAPIQLKKVIEDIFKKNNIILKKTINFDSIILHETKTSNKEVDNNINPLEIALEEDVVFDELPF